MVKGEKTSPLRFAVLCDSDEIEQWQLEALQHLTASNIGELAAIVMRRLEAPPGQSRKRISRYTLYNLYFRRVARRCAAKRTASISAAFPGVEVIEVETERGAKGRTLIADGSLPVLADLELDFAVRFGFGILSGPALMLPRFGVWSFHHGNPAEFRGQPPGVWEIIKGAPTTGAIVQKLNETLDGGQVLAFARFPTIASSYTRQLDQIFSGSAPLLTSAATACARTHELANIDMGELGPIYRKPTTGPALTLFVRMLVSKFSGFIGSLVRHQQWAVFVTKKPLQELLEGGHRQDAAVVFTSSIQLPEEPGLFNADPFARRRPDGTLRLFFERFDWKTGRGHIATCAMAPDGSFGPTETVLLTSGHLSYPFILDDGAAMSLLPESIEEGALVQHQISPDGCLAPSKRSLGPAVLDPTVIVHDGKYWMFYCGDDRNTTLNIRYADRLEGPWREHAANPVKIDVIGARPAGPVIAIGDHLIRPGQICTPRYGHGIVFNRIVTLNEQSYAEVPVASITPASRGRYRDGIHTLSAVGDWLVLDLARPSFFAHEMWRVLRSKFSRFLVLKRA